MGKPVCLAAGAGAAFAAAAALVRGSGYFGWASAHGCAPAIFKGVGQGAGPEPQHRDRSLFATGGRRLFGIQAAQRCVCDAQCAASRGQIQQPGGCFGQGGWHAAGLGYPGFAIADRPAHPVKTRPVECLPLPLCLRHLRPPAVSHRGFPGVLRAQPGSLSFAAVDA